MITESRIKFGQRTSIMLPSVCNNLCIANLDLFTYITNSTLTQARKIVSNRDTKPTDTINKSNSEVITVKGSSGSTVIWKKLTFIYIKFRPMSEN